MAPQRLRHVKREIRVFGVAARREDLGYLIVGIVFRGSLWLDGVLKATSSSADLTDAIAEMLRGSPHSGQVRVILLNRDMLPGEASVSIEKLSDETGKPVIILGAASSGGEKTYTLVRGDDAVEYSTTGLGRWTAEGVLKAATREGIVPEALRVAALTLSALPEGEQT